MFMYDGFVYNQSSTGNENFDRRSFGFPDIRTDTVHAPGTMTISI